MEVLALAQKMELEGKAYYERLAAETTVAELKGVFTFLAGEEQKHFDLFQSMEKKQAVASTENTGSMSQKVKEIFSVLTASFALPEVVYDYQAAYGKALEMERQSVKYYSDMAASVDSSEKKILNFIIAQEEGHAKLMESLMEFVANPKTWLENAEWRNIDSY
jgi:rubrerythrin